MGNQNRILTQVAMRVTTVRIKRRDDELLRAAAARVELSQSEFLRAAIREKAERVLRVSKADSTAAGES